ncbi:hypothetical protein D3C85_1359270 [compost metagenome]
MFRPSIIRYTRFQEHWKFFVGESNTLDHLHRTFVFVGCNKNGLVFVEHSEPQKVDSRNCGLTSLTSGQYDRISVLDIHVHHLFLVRIQLKRNSTTLRVLYSDILFAEVDGVFST